MIRRPAAMVLLICVLTLPLLASAGTLDNLKNQASGVMNSQKGSAGGGQLLQQLGSGSFNLGSMQNAAGVLGYCKKQGYAPSASETVKNKLMDKLGVQGKNDDNAGYKEGLTGLLKGQNGKRFDLSNLKDQVGKRVCSALADRAAASFLGS
jgi:hypothetical protein